jgi:hypothetical protein
MCILVHARSDFVLSSARDKTMDKTLERTQMNHKNPKPATTLRHTAPAASTKRWTRPTITRTRAGAAELGPNPENPEGSFGEGS